MQNTLMVSGVECKTKLIDGFWYIVVDGIPQKLYRGWIYRERARNKRMMAYKLKEKCVECGKDFFGKLSDLRKFCSLSCSGKVNGKINIKKLHALHIELTKNGYLRQKAGSFINRGIANGRIIRSKVCSNCNCRGDIVFHHPNYDKINVGMWLCTSCHRKLHYGHDINGKLTIYSIVM